MPNDFYVFSKSKMPTVPHWAVIEYGSISIPGDERSRTNPGHGYPASTEPYLRYHVFDTKTDLESWLARSTAHVSTYSVMFVTPGKVEVQHSVSVAV